MTTMAQPAPSRQAYGKRPWTFYALAAFFALFVAFLYGPMSAIYILSFQGPTGGLTFPMQGTSLRWFHALFEQERTGDFAGAFTRSMTLAIIQSSVDDAFRGRATSIYQVTTLTPMALFGWGMGGLADIAEPRPLMITCGLAFLVVMAIYSAASTRLRVLFTPDGWILPSHVQPAPVTV